VGQIIGNINDESTCKELIEGIVAEAKEVREEGRKKVML